MKEKICIFNADSDVAAIDCNISDAAVTFKKTDDNALSVILPSAKNVHAGNDKGTLYISQTKRTALFARRQKIIVCVPEHIVPSLTFNGKRCTLEIEGNIYADINIIAENGNISLTDTSANDLEINGDRLSISINDSTFKGNLYVNARAAEFTVQHSFAGLAVVRTKSGNMGLIGLAFKDCTLETEEGEITATLIGKREEYNMRLVTKSGADAEEIQKIASADKNFNAYTANGNIVVCFADNEKAADELVFTDDVIATEEKIPEKEI